MSTQVIIPNAPSVPVPSEQKPDEAERQRVERRKTYGPLEQFIRNTCKRVEEEDKPERLNILKQQNQCQGYYDGKFNGDWNERGEWVESPYDPKELLYYDNRYKEQIEKLQTEMARSYVDLEVNAVDETDSALREAAEFLKSRVDANRKRLFIQHPEIALAENMSLLIKSLTFRYTYFDAEAKDGPKEQRPTFGKVSIGDEKSLSLCGVCSRPRANTSSGEPSPSEPCENCGSTSIKPLSTSPLEIEVPNGTEDAPCGLVRCVHVDPSMVQVSLNARNMDVRSTPYLVWTQMVERGKLEQMFPDRVIPSGASTDESRQRRDNESSVSNAAWGQGWNSSPYTTQGGSQFERLEFKLIWLDPWVYGDYRTDKPEGEKLPDGRILPPNVPLIQFFPEGCCIAKVYDTPLMMYSEDKNLKWSMCVYGLREHALHGSGTNSLIYNQKNINDILSFRMTNAYQNSARREFFAQNKISGDQLPPIDKACAVTNLEQGETLPGAVYGQAPGIPLPAEVVELSKEQTGSLQEQAGTSSLSLAGTSAESQALGTATGIAAVRDMAVGRMGPNLMLKAAMEVETAFQCVELEQKNYSRQHLFALAGLRPDRPAGNLGYTASGVEAFINADIRADFTITPVPGSWMPTTEQEKKADALAMADASSKTQNPDVLTNLAKVLKQPMTIGGWGATEREAARRLEEFGKVALLYSARPSFALLDEQAQGILDQAVNARMSVEMDDHQAFRKFYRDWWVSDESRSASPQLKRAVELRYIEHKDAMVENVQDANARTAEGQIPNKIAEVLSNRVDAAEAGQQAQSQIETQGQAAQQQMRQAVAQKGIEAQDREHRAGVELATQAASNEMSRQDREHDLQTKVADREHQQAMRDTRNASPITETA